MNSKAKLIWFNRLPTNVKLTDLYPQKASAPTRQTPGHRS